MSARITPAEMADFMDRQARRMDHTDYDDADTMREIAEFLRRQPTDAQKIEALQAERMAVMCRMDGRLSDEFHYHREALRLLDLPTGDDTP